MENGDEAHTTSNTNDHTTSNTNAGVARGGWRTVIHCPIRTKTTILRYAPRLKVKIHVALMGSVQDLAPAVWRQASHEIIPSPKPMEERPSPP